MAFEINGYDHFWSHKVPQGYERLGQLATRAQSGFLSGYLLQMWCAAVVILVFVAWFVM